MAVGDARARLSSKRTAQVGIDVERSADERVVVRIDDRAAAVPNLDAPELLAHGGALQPVVGLGHIGLVHGAGGQLLSVEERLDAYLGNEAGAGSGCIQIPLLNVRAQNIGKDCPQRHDRHKGQKPKSNKRSQCARSEFRMEIVTVRPQGSAALTTHRWMPNSAPAGVSELLVQPRVLICFGAWLGRQLKAGTDSRGIPQSLPDAS